MEFDVVFSFFSVVFPSFWQWGLLFVSLAITALSLKQILNSRFKYNTSNNTNAIVASIMVMMALAGLILKPLYRAEQEVIVTLHMPDAEALSELTRGPQLTLGFHPDFPQLDNVSTLKALQGRYPHIARLDLNGTQLPLSQIEELSVGAIKSLNPLPQKGLSQLNWDKQINHGQMLRISGVYHFSESQLTELKLVDVAGETLDSVTLRTGERFEFQLVPKTPGAVQYQLENSQGEQLANVHLYVQDGIVQQTLLWGSSPNAEFNGLKKWLLAQQQAVMSEFDISKDKTFSQKSQQSLTRDSSDLIVMDGRKLTRLNSGQLTQLRAQVEAGKGLIIIADNSLQNFSWLQDVGVTLVPHDVARQNVHTLLFEGELSGSAGYQFDAPVNILPLRFAEMVNSSALLRNAKGQVVALQKSLGKGNVVVTLISDSFVLGRQQQVTDYGVYWQTLIEHARPLTTQPRFIAPSRTDNSVTRNRVEVCALSLLPEIETQIRFTAPQSATSDYVIPMSGKAHRPALKCGYFWPTYSGWHRLNLLNNEGRTLAETAIYVYEYSDFADITTFKLHRAIEHYNANTAKVPDDTASLGLNYQGINYRPVPAHWFALLWLIGAGYLWWRKR